MKVADDLERYVVQNLELGAQSTQGKDFECSLICQQYFLSSATRHSFGMPIIVDIVVHD